MTASAGGAAPYPSSTDDEVRSRSVGDLVGDISRDLTTLVRQEIELAKTETREEVGKSAKAAGMLGGAGLSGYMAAFFVSLTVAYAIGTFWPAWAGALVVAAIWAIAGAFLYQRGRQRLSTVSPPKKTIETLKEDATWARHPTS